MSTPMNPNNVILVAKHNGKEVGRKAATDPNANEWMSELARHYNGLQIEYVEDKDAAMISRLFSRR